MFNVVANYLSIRIKINFVRLGFYYIWWKKDEKCTTVNYANSVELPNLSAIKR